MWVNESGQSGSGFLNPPNVDLTNIIIADQQSQHGDPKVRVEPTPDPITLVAQNLTPKPITPVAQNPTPKLINPVAQNPELTPKPVVKVHSFLIYMHLLI